MNAQERVEKVKSLVFDIRPRKEKRKAEKYVEDELTPSDGLTVAYVNRYILNLCDTFDGNNPIKERLRNITNIPEEQKKPEKKGGILKKLTPYLPFLKYAAMFWGWIQSFNAH